MLFSLSTYLVRVIFMFQDFIDEVLITSVSFDISFGIISKTMCETLPYSLQHRVQAMHRNGPGRVHFMLGWLLLSRV